MTQILITIELSDDLLERGKAAVRREDSALKARIEDGLRIALEARTRKCAAPFAVQPLQVDGLSAECTAARWKDIRDEIDRGRGWHQHVASGSLIDPNELVFKPPSSG